MSGVNELRACHVKIIIFLNNLGLGGTEKAAFRWAWGMKERSQSGNGVDAGGRAASD